MHAKFWTEMLREADYLGDLYVDERILLRQVLRKSFERVWTVSGFLRVQSQGGHV
jgi:hypothetical protein